MITIPINIDVTEPYKKPIKISQYDVGSPVFDITLLNGGQPINLTGALVTFAAIKPDKTLIGNSCVVSETEPENGKCTYAVTSQTSIVDGTLACQFIITFADEAEKRSLEFKIEVSPSIDITGAAESTNEFTSLQTALIAVAAFGSRLSAAESDIDDLEAENAEHETRIAKNEGDILNIPNKNYVINGNIQINQRAVSGTVVLSAGQYGHDRFKAGASGCTYTFATSGNVTTITILSGSLKQVIEGSSLLNGNHTLSWSGTCQGRINGGSYGTSPRSASLTGGINAEVEFSTGTLSKVKLEAGNVATPFVSKGIAEELRDCQRYCWQGSVPSSSGNVYYGVATSNGLQFIFGFSLPVTMMANPTVTIITPPTYQNCSFSGWAADANGVCMRGDITAAGAYRAFGGVYRADAEL